MKKALNLIGLMARAGKIITGEELIIKNIQSKKIKLLLIAYDCGKNTSKKLLDKSNYYGIENVILFSIEEISNAIGKENRVALGIIDVGFSDKFKELVKEGGCIDNGKN